MDSCCFFKILNETKKQTQLRKPPVSLRNYGLDNVGYVLINGLVYLLAINLPFPQKSLQTDVERTFNIKEFQLFEAILWKKHVVCAVHTHFVVAIRFILQNGVHDPTWWI